MATFTQYHVGGFKPAAPQQNRSEVYDGAAGTYTSWDVAGGVTSTRPLTGAESARLAAQDAEVTTQANGATLRDQAAAALAANRTYIALASPSTGATTTQVKALSKQVNGLIRLMLGALDGTD